MISRFTKFAASAVLFILWGVPGQVLAQADDGPTPSCMLGKTAEPTDGKCQPIPLDRLCEADDPKAVVKQFCVAGNSCPKGATDLGTVNGASHYCYGRQRSCPKTDVVVQKAPQKCLAWASLPPKGGKKEDVQSSNPGCSAGTGDASSCHWMCLRAPTGKKIAVGTLQFLARDRGAVCSDRAGYVAFDATACGTPGTEGRCAPFYYSWEAFKVTDEEACGRIKNWSHDTSRCAAISFEPTK